MNRNLPKLTATGLNGLRFDAPAAALERFDDVRAAEADDPNTISIYGDIGEDGFGDGVSEKRIAAALRKIGAEDITVNINSPGGSFFTGVAIYNLLREHPGQVTARVIGLAASAASVIAMAADRVEVGAASFLMIHNAHAIAIGNRHDMADAARLLEPFDKAMAKLYAQRSGMGESDVAAMMDAETWLSGDQAKELGFADAVVNLPITADENAEARAALAARIKADAALARAGLTRSERRALINELRDTRNAVAEGTRNAAEDVTRNADAELIAAMLSSGAADLRKNI